MGATAPLARCTARRAARLPGQATRKGCHCAVVCRGTQRAGGAEGAAALASLGGAQLQPHVFLMGAWQEGGGFAGRAERPHTTTQAARSVRVPSPPTLPSPPTPLPNALPLAPQGYSLGGMTTALAAASTLPPPPSSRGALAAAPKTAAAAATGASLAPPTAQPAFAGLMLTSALVDPLHGAPRRRAQPAPQPRLRDGAASACAFHSALPKLPLSADGWALRVLRPTPAPPQATCPALAITRLPSDAFIMYL